MQSDIKTGMQYKQARRSHTTRHSVVSHCAFLVARLVQEPAHHAKGGIVPHMQSVAQLFDTTLIGGGTRIATLCRALSLLQ